jgi:hypothetical protein
VLVCTKNAIIWAGMPIQKGTIGGRKLRMGSMSPGGTQYTWLERLATDKHSSLLGSVVSYEEK